MIAKVALHKRDRGGLIGCLAASGLMVAHGMKAEPTAAAHITEVSTREVVHRCREVDGGVAANAAARENL